MVVGVLSVVAPSKALSLAFTVRRGPTASNRTGRISFCQLATKTVGFHVYASLVFR